MGMLSLLIFLPILAVPIVLILPREQTAGYKTLTMFVSCLEFVLSIYLFLKFDAGNPGFQFVENREWIGDLVRYHVGVDGVTILLILLTTFLTPITLLGAWRTIKEKQKEFCVSVLMLESAMIGTFLSLDLVLFYVFWEFMLVPMYLIIGVWGGPKRIYATIKFVLFTMFGSVLMLVAIIYLFVRTGSSTFDYETIVNLVNTQGHLAALRMKEQLFLFLAFGLAFAIKVPLFPFHTWLPDAHVEAPTPGSVILAGILLKMGVYGFLRFAIPIFPAAAAVLSGPIMLLAVVGIIYGALVAFVQADVKKLVAYSSVAHMGFVVLGMFAMTREGIQGAILQMVNHGISTGGLFLCVGFLYERRHTRLISDYGGIAKVMPFFAAAFMLVTLSSIGLPGTNGFVGEFLILSGVFKEGIGSAVIPSSIISWRNFVLLCGALAGLGIVLGAVYMLTMFRKVMFGRVTREENKRLLDLNWREKFVIIPILMGILFIGLAPNVVLHKTRATVDRFVEKYQPVMMQKRNKKTYNEVRSVFTKTLEMQLQRQFGRRIDLGPIEWRTGPFDDKGGDK